MKSGDLMYTNTAFFGASHFIFRKNDNVMGQKPWQH